MQLPKTEKQLETMGNFSQIAEQVEVNYTEVVDTRFVDQTVNDFLFPLEEDGSVEHPITVEENEGFFEPRTPVSDPESQPPVMDTRPTLLFNKKL